MSERLTLPVHLDPARVRSHIAESHAAHSLLERERPTLIAQHEGQWVAAFDGEFVFADTLEGVVAAAQAKSWPLDVVAIERLTRQPRRVLL